MFNKPFISFPVLKTDRLLLRPLVIEDDKEILALRSNEKVNTYLDRTPDKTIEDSRIFIHNILKNSFVYWAITIHDQLIGTICLFDFEGNAGKAEIGFELLPEHQGKGIMHEAVSKVISYSFETIHLVLLEGYVHKDNVPSQKLLEKLNFKQQTNHMNNNETNFILFKLTK